MIGRDAFTVSDFCGTLANRLTLFVSVKSPRCCAGGRAPSRNSSREFAVGDGDDDGVETEVSWVVTLPFVMLEGVVYPESRWSGNKIINRFFFSLSPTTNPNKLE